jgi:hypothetical protein
MKEDRRIGIPAWKRRKNATRTKLAEWRRRARVAREDPFNRGREQDRIIRELLAEIEDLNNQRL